ncbi:MAG: ABC transporter ATP-binding protein [Verrucomicrobiota bacterium]
MIQARNLVKRFGPKVAVNDVSFDVNPGEVLGFLGPNGAGKSTTMRMITGFLPPSAGTVTVNGHDIADQPINAKKAIGYLPENAPAYPEMTVLSFLRFVAELHGMRGSEREMAVDRVVETCFLRSVLRQPIGTLSKGFRHRTCLAQSLIADPPVLVLDEPTDGLDPNQKYEVRQLIERMGTQKAIIISTHILEEVDAVCSRIIIIDNGKLVYNGDPDELRKRSRTAGAVIVATRHTEADRVEAILNGLADTGDVQRVCTDIREARFTVFPAAPPKAQQPPLAVRIADELRGNDITVDELHTERGRLDEVFRDITVSETSAWDTPVAQAEQDPEEQKTEKEAAA